MSKDTKKIICIFFSKGRRHDFRIFKESKIKFHSEINLLTDGGYRRLKKLHAKTPKRRSKKNSLTTRQKIINSFPKRFGLRFNLIAGIYNLELC